MTELSILNIMPKLFTTSDISIRKALVDNLKSEFTDTASIILSEYTLATTGTRADIVVINGVLHGYEVKSDADSLTRLNSQVHGYNEVFDRMTLVVGERHLIHSMYSLPDWWGITLAKRSEKGEVSLFKLREPLQNPLQKSKTLARLLWKTELVRLLKDYDLYYGFHGCTKEQLVSAASAIPLESLKISVKDFLAIRTVNYANALVV